MWLEKTDRKQPEELSGIDEVIIGTLSEDAMARYYELRKGKVAPHRYWGSKGSESLILCDHSGAALRPRAKEATRDFHKN